MEEQTMKNLWKLCALLQDFCGSHDDDCTYCPFKINNGDRTDCMLEKASSYSTDEFSLMFPEKIILDVLEEVEPIQEDEND